MIPLAARAVGGYAHTVSGLLLFFGMLGLVRTHFNGFASSEGAPLLTFTANPLTYLICLVAGLVGIAMAGRLDSARRYAVQAGVSCTAWGLLEFVVRDSSADIFGRDTGLALVTVGIGLAGLAVWMWERPNRGARTADA